MLPLKFRRRNSPLGRVLLMTHVLVLSLIESANVGVSAEAPNAAGVEILVLEGRLIREGLLLRRTHQSSCNLLRG